MELQLMNCRSYQSQKHFDNILPSKCCIGSIYALKDTFKVYYKDGFIYIYMPKLLLNNLQLNPIVNINNFRFCTDSEIANVEIILKIELTDYEKGGISNCRNTIWHAVPLLLQNILPEIGDMTWYDNLFMDIWRIILDKTKFSDEYINYRRQCTRGN